MRRNDIIGIIVCCLLLIGCGHQSEEKHASQVAAKVNRSEITVHQVNRLLQEAGESGKTEGAARKALDRLIDQELLVQKSIENHLDRTPDVLQALENSRRQILSQAYLQRLVIPHTPITEQELQDFFRTNPDLFEKRRIYQLQVFTLEQSKLDEAMNAELDKAQTPEHIREILKQKQIAFQEETATKPAEQLPMELLPSFAKSKLGDVIVISQVNKTVLMQVINLAERPVTFAQAKPLVEQFLNNQKNRQVTENHIKQLRATIPIEYVGDFNKLTPMVSKSAENPPTQPSTTPAPQMDDRKSLEKGLSGLK
jgi:EpsD family peptidyl-prolyl cis-trans isomerase